MKTGPGKDHRLFASILLGIAVLSAAGLAVIVPGTGAFFGTGAALLVAGLCGAYLVLVVVFIRGGVSASAPRLALRGAAINRGRSMLAIGLLACATFVVTAVAAYTRDYSGADVRATDSGTGGFTLRAISSIPIPYDFGTAAGREKLGFQPEDEELFEDVEVRSFLMNSGDNISCRNLAKTDSPRVLGVSQEVIDRDGFGVITLQGRENPWTALLQRQEGGRFPVFGDADTLKWQLHVTPGERFTIDAPGGDVPVWVAGKIPGSIFAGELLMAQKYFERVYPNADTPRYFLLRTPPGKTSQVAEALRRSLGDMGLEVRTTREILNEVMSVQNAYISTFLALGGLGVALGTFGLVVVLLRTALERRGEFALLLATGFRHRFLSRLLLLENAGLLVAGLVCGTVSAMVAVAPQLRSAVTDVNWLALGAILAAILIVGLASCTIASRAVVRKNLLEALRAE
jgi:hypothetical protein